MPLSEAEGSDGGEETRDPTPSETTVQSTLQKQIISPPFTDEVAEAVADATRVLQQEEGEAPQHSTPATLLPAFKEVLQRLVAAFEKQTLLMFGHWHVEEAKREAYLQESNMHVVDQLRREMGSPYQGKPAPLSPHMTNLLVGAEGVGGAVSVPPSTLFRDAVTPGYTAPAPGRKGRNPKGDLKRGACLTLHLHLSALATQVQASQAVLYLYDKTTSTLRSLSSVPHGINVTVPSHLGVQGAVFNSSVAFNLNKVEEDAAPLLKSADSQAHRITKNFLAFPLISGTQRSAIGVVELVNKRGGAKFTSTDEATAYHTASTLFHIVKQLPAETLQGLNSSSTTPLLAQLAPSHDLNLTQPIKPEDIPEERDETSTSPKRKDEVEEGSAPPVGQTSRTQLVFRPEAGAKLDVTSSGSKSAPVTDCGNVKELHNYLQTLEDSYRRGLNKYVLIDAEKQSIIDDLARKTQRIRVLEENATYLGGQIQQLQNGRDSGVVAGHTANFNNFTVDGHEEVSKGAAGGVGVASTVPIFLPGGLDADHPPELRETLTMAQRLANVINAPPPVTTAIPSTDHVLAVNPKAKTKFKSITASHTGQALRALKRRYGG